MHGLDSKKNFTTNPHQNLEEKRAQGVSEEQRQLWKTWERKHHVTVDDEDDDNEDMGGAEMGRAGIMTFGKARSRAKQEGKQGKVPI
jgi:hypothetical protein